MTNGQSGGQYGPPAPRQRQRGKGPRERKMASETVRIESAKEYGYEFGFVVEQLRYWNGDDRQTWAIPAWEEMGLGGLGGVFPTRHAAQAALNSFGAEA